MVELSFHAKRRWDTGQDHLGIYLYVAGLTRNPSAWYEFDVGHYWTMVPF